MARNGSKGPLGGVTAPQGTLRISDLSRLTGVPMSTLRVWEDRGLLKPRYTKSGYRLFDSEHIDRALDIKRMRTVQGLGIAAIKASIRPERKRVRTSAGQRNEGGKPGHANGPNPLGSRLRELRHARKLTMREVSEKTGVDQTVLASIERTSLGVQIPVLQALAKSYDVTLTSLMDQTPLTGSREVVTRAGKGRILPTLGHGLRIEQLATGKDMMDFQRWFIKPGVHSHGSYNHDGEELIYVMVGEFEITLQDERVYLLRQGDSIYFKSSWKHSWINPGETTAILIWVNTPPTF